MASNLKQLPLNQLRLVLGACYLKLLHLQQRRGWGNDARENIARLRLEHGTSTWRPLILRTELNSEEDPVLVIH